MPRLILAPWNQLDPRPFLAGHMVLTPNKRAAQDLDVPFDSLESLARLRLKSSLDALAKPLQTHRLMLRVVTENLPGDDPAGAARTMAPVVRTLLRAGASLSRLEAEGSSRVQRIARCASRYKAALREAGWLDPAEVLRAAAELDAPKQALLVHGYPRLGLDERALIAAAAAQDSVVLLPACVHGNYADNEATADYFESLGWEVTRIAGPALASPLEGLIPEGVVAEAHEYANMEEEVRGVLGSIKHLLASGVPADEIGLVARNDAFYGPLMLDIAHEYQLPLRALYAVPLSQTRLGSWIKQVVEAAGRELSFEATFRLIEHPLSPWFPPEKRAEARKTHPMGPAAWRELGVNLSLLDWPAEAPRGHWSGCVQRLVRDLGVRKQAARWPREALAVRVLLESLSLVFEPAHEVISREAFGQELLEVLNLLAVPAHPGRGGVELHTPLSLYGARYRHLFVVGVAENVMPAPVSNSPVLDFYERKQLAALDVQLEDAAGAARREFLSFASLMRVASEALVLSYPRLLGDREALPSAYFKGLGLKPIQVAPAIAASYEEARRIWVSRGQASESDAVWPLAANALEIEIARESAAPADAHDGVVGLPYDHSQHVFSASQLTMLGQCAFKWYASYLLGLEAPEEFEGELSPRLRGDLYHRTLELAVARAKGEPDLVAASLKHLEPAFEQAEAEFATTQLPAWAHRREEHLRKLRQVVEAPDFFDPGTTIAGTETKFKAQDWHGLRLTGKVDRIDRTPDGLVLIDYKTSGSVPAGAQDASGVAKLDIQLPLYIEAAAPALFPDETVKGARYYSLTKAKKLAEASPDPEALRAFAERVKARLQEGDYGVGPDKGRKACQYCDFELVCRKGARLVRKESHA